VADRHVAAQNAACDHTGEIDGVFRASELGRVAQLRLLEVVDRRAHLDRHGERADALVHVVLAERLRAEEASVGFPENDFYGDRPGSGVVPRV